MGRKISIIGILTVIVYFISVGGFLVTKTEIALTIWEMMTIISGPILFMVLLEFSRYFDVPDIFRTAMAGFMSCVCALTGLSHIVNMEVLKINHGTILIKQKETHIRAIFALKQEQLLKYLILMIAILRIASIILMI